LEVDEMVGQLIRAAEAPISLSISVARKGVELTGRVAGWALTEVVSVLSPDRRNGSFAPADTEPAVKHAKHEPGTGTSVPARDPHSALNNPITEADLTEWPDPYDHREDPRDPGEEMVFGGEAGNTQTGATSTSEPHPSQDPEAEAWEGPKRDKVDQ
jgi:hypothetical protein